MARSTFRSQNAKNTTCSDHFWTFNRTTLHSHHHHHHNNNYYYYTYTYTYTCTCTCTYTYTYTFTTLHCIALHCTKLHYTFYTTLYYNYTALHCTTLHPAVAGEVTTATTPKSKTTFRSISCFALPSMHHNSSPLLQLTIFETSATALRGTTGTLFRFIPHIDVWGFCF